MKTIYIKEAAARVGVSAITLKRWLLAGKVEEVARDYKGWRIFTENDIERIMRYCKNKNKTKRLVIGDTPQATTHHIDDQIVSALNNS